MGATAHRAGHRPLGIKDHLVTFRDPDNIRREFFWAKANLVASPPRRLRRLADEARVALDGPHPRASWCRCQVCGSTNGKDAVTLDGRRCHHRHSSPTWEAAGRAGATGNHDRRPRPGMCGGGGLSGTAMEAAARPRAEPRRAGHRSDSAGHRRCYWPLGRPLFSRPRGRGSRSDRPARAGSAGGRRRGGGGRAMGGSLHGRQCGLDRPGARGICGTGAG
jgi:hypothetical protein